MTDRVAVAGMGPVGMVAALALAEAGVPVVVFEKGPTLPEESRASTFHAATLEMLEELDLAQPLIAGGLEAPTFQQRDRRDGVLADLDLGLLSDETAYPYRLQSEQVNLTRLVLERLGRLDDVELRFGCPVRRVETAADHVLVWADDTEAPERFGWVIGAEGTRSATRSSLGIAFEGMTYPERFLVVSSDHDWQTTFPDLALVTYIADPEEWMVLLRTPRHWRALFPVRLGESDDDATSPARVQERLQGIASRAEPYPVLHTTIYSVHQRVAAVFHRGRALLAGDAAHINNPLGGMGMNSGIHDAMAAAKTIVAARDGADPDGCAEAYARIRRQAALDYVQAETHRNFTALRETDEHSRRRRADELAALVDDPDALRSHLRRASMLASARRTSAILGAALDAVGRPTTLSRLSATLDAAVTWVPRCHDELEARQAATGAGGLLISAVPRRARGHPDGTGDLVDWRETADRAARIAAEVDLPLVVEVGRGWRGEVDLMVATMERAGAAAILVDDHRIGEDEMGRRLTDVLRARHRMQVIARATTVEGSLTPATMRRCRMFAERGVDVVMADSATDGESLRVLRRELSGVPLARWGRFGDLDHASSESLRQLGVALVLGSREPSDANTSLAGKKGAHP